MKLYVTAGWWKYNRLKNVKSAPFYFPLTPMAILGLRNRVKINHTWLKLVVLVTIMF